MSTYEGWSNRETWHVNLYLDNDEGMYKMVRRMTRSALRDTDSKREAVQQLASEIASLVEDGNPLHDAGSLYSDILTDALNSVNYEEIAEAKIAAEED